MKLVIRFLAFLLACHCIALTVRAQDSGVKVSVVMHDDGSKTVSKVDPDNHTSESATYGTNEKLQNRTVFTLDEKNRAVSGVSYTASGKPVKKFTYKYDESDRLSEEQDFTVDDKYIGKFVYEYSVKGKLTRIRAYDAAGNEVSATRGTPDRKKH